MKSIRLIQITDTHLLEDAEGEIFGVKPESAFKKVIAYAVSAKINPNCIIATGDLSDDGSHNAYFRMQAIFSNIELPVFVVPGNHDSIQNMRSSLVDSNIKMEDMAEIGGWVIIFLNSVIEGEDHGIIDHKALLTLGKQLEAIGNKFCLIALHHSPIPGCITSGCQLQNWQPFLNLIASYQSVKVVISGHVHKPSKNVIAGLELLTTPSTFVHVIHPQQVDNEKIIGPHLFNTKKMGFRVIDLFPDGTFNSKVCWIEP
jgi:Icc protein